VIKKRRRPGGLQRKMFGDTNETAEIQVFLEMDRFDTQPIVA